MAAKNIFVLDNGGYSIKAGFTTSVEPRYCHNHSKTYYWSNDFVFRIMPNAVMKAKSERRRPFIGDQLEECRDVSGLYYILPVQKVMQFVTEKSFKFNTLDDCTRDI